MVRIIRMGVLCSHPDFHPEFLAFPGTPLTDDHRGVPVEIILSDLLFLFAYINWVKNTGHIFRSVLWDKYIKVLKVVRQVFFSTTNLRT